MAKHIGNGGSVELLETFGDDLTVVNAARVSFNKKVTEFATKDKGLIAERFPVSWEALMTT